MVSVPLHCCETDGNTEGDYTYTPIAKLTKSIEQSQKVPFGRTIEDLN